MENQPEPSASSCPYCGGDPEYDPEHILAASGYTHDDIHFTCKDCERDWTCGVPIGEHDGEFAKDLFCRSCTERYGLVHRVQPITDTQVLIHLKCPNCYNFWQMKRKSDDGVILMGYPQITGDTDNASRPYGHPVTLSHSQKDD